MKNKYKHKLFLRRVLILGIFSGLLILGSNFFTINLTPSLPRGIYFMRNYKTLNKGDIVLFEVPEQAKVKNYIPRFCKAMLKEIGALENDKVEIKEDSLYINGSLYGKIQKADSEGYKFPELTVEELQPQKGEFLPLAPHEKSWDGRYWGTLPLNIIEKKAKLVYPF